MKNTITSFIMIRKRCQSDDLAESSKRARRSKAVEAGAVISNALSCNDTGDEDGLKYSLLSKLPAELRIQIFELALTSPTAYGVGDQRPINRQAVQPPLTRTCRQIRKEALPVFYECNTFNFYLNFEYGVERVRKWMQSMSESSASIQTIRSVGLEGYIAEDWPRRPGWFPGASSELIHVHFELDLENLLVVTKPSQTVCTKGLNYRAQTTNRLRAMIEDSLSSYRGGNPELRGLILRKTITKFADQITILPSSKKKR